MSAGCCSPCLHGFVPAEAADPGDIRRSKGWVAVLEAIVKRMSKNNHCRKRPRNFKEGDCSKVWEGHFNGVDGEYQWYYWLYYFSFKDS